jgi:competence transcription factor ComK
MLGCSFHPKKSSSSIKGRWIAVKPASSYITLDFADSTAVFDNRGDTINRFSYTVDQLTQTLLLTDPFGEKRKAKIVKVDADSLIFNKLWDLATTQRFYKSKKITY